MKKILMMMIMGMMLITLVSAVPPAIIEEPYTTGIFITTSPQQDIVQHQGIHVNFMTHNITTGAHMTNESIDCRLVLEDNKGDILAALEADYYEVGNFWRVPLLGGNFTRLGQYNYAIECIDDFDGTTGGVTTGTLIVSPTGFADTFTFYLLILLILVGVVILGFSIKEAWFVVLGGMGLIMFGLYTMNSGLVGFKDMYMTWGISLFEIAVGTILAVGAGMQKVHYD